MLHKLVPYSKIA